MLVRICSTALVLAGLSSQAQAQIYTSRDANGHMVLSDKLIAGAELRTYSVPAAASVRTTRPAPAERGHQFDDLISEHSRKNGVRTDLVRAVMQVESAFNPYARSPKGAMGLMQLMPDTAKQFGVKNAFNPAENVRAGVAYLRGLLDRYQDNEELALAAYNAGPGAVDKYRQTVPPYRETKNYVAQITKMSGPKVEQIRGSKIYKLTDIIDGREVVRYTDKKPAQ
jgi:soluble lytic murein transglycosylase-like protein